MSNELYMNRCLQIAAFARGNTSPNPMVGAVIVCDGRIISEGYHHKAGEPHAEPNAINSVADKKLLQRSTLFVNLEPCSHYGKTPPCAQLIIKMGIPHVIVGMLDPNPIVAGRGVKMMQEAGINVEVGVIEEKCKELNKRFTTYHTKHRPYVILKWAQTADGYLDTCRTEKGDGAVRISNEVTKALNHQVRTQEDAILVGTSTAYLDDPHLTSRKWHGHNPIRCVIDLNHRLPMNLKLWDTSARTILFTSDNKSSNLPANIEIVYMDRVSSLPIQILQALYERQIQSVIIEGGAMTLNAFISEDLWDEARVETSILPLRSGVSAPKLPKLPVETEFCYNNRVDFFVAQV